MMNKQQNFRLIAILLCGVLRNAKVGRADNQSSLTINICDQKSSKIGDNVRFFDYKSVNSLWSSTEEKVHVNVHGQIFCMGLDHQYNVNKYLIAVNSIKITMTKDGKQIADQEGRYYFPKKSDSLLKKVGVFFRRAYQAGTKLFSKDKKNQCSKSGENPHEGQELYVPFEIYQEPNGAIKVLKMSSLETNLIVKNWKKHLADCLATHLTVDRTMQPRISSLGKHYSTYRFNGQLPSLSSETERNVPKKYIHNVTRTIKKEHFLTLGKDFVLNKNAHDYIDILAEQNVSIGSDGIYAGTVGRIQLDLALDERQNNTFDDYMKIKSEYSLKLVDKNDQQGNKQSWNEDIFQLVNKLQFKPETLAPETTPIDGIYEKSSINRRKVSSDSDFSRDTSNCQSKAVARKNQSAKLLHCFSRKSIGSSAFKMTTISDVDVSQQINDGRKQFTVNSTISIFGTIMHNKKKIGDLKYLQDNSVLNLTLNFAGEYTRLEFTKFCKFDMDSPIEYHRNFPMELRFSLGLINIEFDYTTSLTGYLAHGDKCSNSQFTIRPTLKAITSLNSKANILGMVGGVTHEGIANINHEIKVKQQSSYCTDTELNFKKFGFQVKPWFQNLNCNNGTKEQLFGNGYSSHVITNKSQMQKSVCLQNSN